MINLAGLKECDADIVKELTESGATVLLQDHVHSEVPYHYIGCVGNFILIRAWYYWVAKSIKGLPESAAEELNANYRNVIRVKGFAGGTDVKQWLSENNTIDLYHIDTQEGLNAFVKFVKEQQQ